MKQMINDPDAQIKNHIPNFKNNTEQNAQTIQDRMNQGRKDSQNQLDNIDKRRNTINKRAQ